MKKFISILLSAILVFACMIPAFATESESAEVSYDGEPVVVVRGFDFMGLHYEDGSPALTFTFGNIFPGVVKLLFNMMLFNEKGMVQALVDTANTLFGPIAADHELNSLENIFMDTYTTSMDEYPDFFDKKGRGAEEGILATAVDSVGAENCFFFTYDWRKSPRVLAAELNTLIETAKQETGKDKVRLVSASMGTVVTSAYMYYYGYDSVYNCTFVSGALNGIYTIGDLFTGNILFDADMLGNFLENAVSGQNVLVKTLVKLLTRGKLLGIVCNFVNSLVDEHKATVFDAGLRDSFGLAMGIWSMCPEADFDEAVEFMFGGHEDEYETVLNELAEMRTFLFATEDIVDGAIARDIPVAFLSNYNKPMTPVVARGNAQGDAVIEVYGTSFYGTAANFGETLTEEQLAGVAAEFISPDHVINASTCRYPAYTWFIKDAAHVATQYGSDYAAFVDYLVMSDTQRTVYENELYPRFMQEDASLSLIPAIAE
ncbi:MAG: hypothetical protein IKJ63_11160 [Clostridia bacterium]|nr:hypothetical protein [Clostridia bacterium]